MPDTGIMIKYFSTDFLDFSLSGDHNSVWFFEKEFSRMQDPTPVYEGVIIEYQHTVKVRHTTQHPTPNFDKGDGIHFLQSSVSNRRLEFQPFSESGLTSSFAWRNAGA